MDLVERCGERRTSKSHLPNAVAAGSSRALSTYLIRHADFTTLVILQVVDQDRGARFLQQQGAMRTIRTSEIPAYRGLVTDRRGQPLAVSTPVVSIWANPQLLTDPAEIERLAPVLGASASALSERIKLYADKQFMYLARHQTPEQARAILDLGTFRCSWGA